MATDERHALLGSTWTCECGREHTVPVREAIIEPGALARTPDLLKQLHLGGPILLLADEITFGIAGQRLEAILRDAGHAVRVEIVSGCPRVDDETAEAVAARVRADDAVLISCGSGSITDLGKFAATRHGLPQIAVATAPSMNGYASSIVAIISKGLKTSIPIQPAVAVVADTDILCAAPMEMIRAGLGDLLSKPFCNSDWKLSSIHTGEHFCPRPFALIRDLEPLYIRDSAGLARRDRRAIGAMTEALVFSGVSMIIAGSSSPASGAEHLVSHFLDMRWVHAGTAHDFHGAQVGIGSIASAFIYERMMQTAAADVDRQQLATAWERGEKLRQDVRALFGEKSDEILAQFAKKRPDRVSYEAGCDRLVSSWDAIRATLSPMLMPAAAVRDALMQAGAKTRFSELGISRQEFCDALHLGMAIRGRYTILDVAHTFGLLDELVDEVADYCS